MKKCRLYVRELAGLRAEGLMLARRPRQLVWKMPKLY